MHTSFIIVATSLAWTLADDVSLIYFLYNVPYFLVALILLELEFIIKGMLYAMMVSDFNALILD